MRIGVNCFLLRSDVGGVRQYFFSLFRELLAKDQKNEYLFFNFPQTIEELPGLIHNTDRARAVNIQDQMEVKSHLVEIDLYFCPFGSLWPRPLPIPTVVTLVDIQEVFYPEFFTQQELYNREFHFVGSTHMADRVITISDFSKEKIIQYHRIPSEKVSAIHLCADERFYNSTVAGHPPDSPLPQNDFIIYPANRWRHKNHDGLLQALKLLKVQKGLVVDAVFTGHDMPNGYHLEEKAREYDLTDQIHSVGYVTTEELAYLYSKAKMLVFPSRYEGFGIPLVEAMAVGCPIVAANAGSLPEIGADGALYFNPSDPGSIASAIEMVWNDPIFRRQLIEKGKKRSLDFSSARLAQNHLLVFDQAIRFFSSLRFTRHRWVYQYYHYWLTLFKRPKVLYSLLLQYFAKLKRFYFKLF